MKRLNRLINSEEYNRYLQKNKHQEKNRVFCRHNWNHFISVARITYLLALEEGLKKKIFAEWQLADKGNLKEVIYTAALLHDIGRWKQYDTGQDHAEASANLAEDLLQDYAYTSLEEKIILTAIKEHRGKPSRDKSILGQLLCRGDDLSRNCRQCSARKECKNIKNPNIKY